MKGLDRLIPLNDGKNGVYLLGDTETGIIYESEYPLYQVKLKMMKEKGLGVVPLAIPIITAVSSIAPSVLNLFGQNKEGQNLQQQQQMLQQQAMIEQQKAQANQQTMLMIGGLGLAAVLVYSVMK